MKTFKKNDIKAEKIQKTAPELGEKAAYYINLDYVVWMPGCKECDAIMSAVNLAEEAECVDDYAIRVIEITEGEQIFITDAADGEEVFGDFLPEIKVDIPFEMEDYSF